MGVPGPRPHRQPFSSSSPRAEPRGRRLAGPPPPSGQRCAQSARLRRGEGLGRGPAHRPPRGEEEPAVPSRHHSDSRLTAVQWGRGSARSKGLDLFATRRSESSARPPRNRRHRHQHRYRPPLRAQRAEGPTASHAARRQGLAPGAPPSLPVHWQVTTPL